VQFASVTAGARPQDAIRQQRAARHLAYLATTDHDRDNVGVAGRRDR
jgi:hypothetical protein